uniref:Mitochondrial enolase superfamily member 1 n=1 Tax=Culicoides sonorensis TaxID=179676 RepID=A0A336MJD8_CULSO
MNYLKNKNIIISDVIAKDIRFPTSLNADGSDAMHKDPDYSCVYVTIITSNDLMGYGMTFTLGRGNEIVLKAVESMIFLVKNRLIHEIYSNFGKFWREITSETQLRWIGPEKGVMHLATAAIINALWDLWGRIEEKPVWKLLVDMSPELLVSTIDFRYITDVITKGQAVELLRKREAEKESRLAELLKNGYPAYTTQVGWLGYSDEKIKQLCKDYLGKGYTAFKIKVGQNLENDIKRCQLVRDEIGYKNFLMVDANQVWDVKEAITWMENLAKFKPLWIEEPTSPDDILGHAMIAKALEQHKIAVATGEMCANRVMFKQFLQANAMQYCQIDSARIGGVNEILSVYLMAAVFGVKVCPHAGGVGLCEMVRHLQMWDFVSLSGSKEGKWIEFVDQQHEHFKDPAIVTNACYVAPVVPGYSTELKKETIEQFEFVNGSQWKNKNI